MTVMGSVPELDKISHSCVIKGARQNDLLDPAGL